MFRFGRKKYHINENEPKHVTCDSEGRTHYFFKGDGQNIQGISRGMEKAKNDKIFEQLPAIVQGFIKKNYDEIVRVKEVGQIQVT